jgi:hypothetical protein
MSEDLKLDMTGVEAAIKECMAKALEDIQNMPDESMPDLSALGGPTERDQILGELKLIMELLFEVNRFPGRYADALGTTLQDVALDLLDVLYGDPIINPDSCGTEQPTVIELAEIPESTMDEADAPDIEYMTWDAMMDDILQSGPGSKYAREDWDNTKNQEYIQEVLGVGLVKYFKRDSVDGFKRAEHTFKPVDQDKVLSWYKINK